MMELGFFLPHVPKDILEMMAIKADSGGFDFMCCLNCVGLSLIVF